MSNWVGIWFQWVHDWGYPGIVILMAMESSIVPIPSEVVIPPAAYWAAQGRYSFSGVVLAGTFGSYLGAAATYWMARWLGRPLLVKYGYLVFCPESKLLREERWLARNGQEAHPDFTLATQNIDGLHGTAGSRRVLELHGSLWRLRCTECGAEAEDRRVPLPVLPHLCAACGGLLRPAVVWFLFQSTSACRLGLSSFLKSTSAARMLAIATRRSGAGLVSRRFFSWCRSAACAEPAAACSISPAAARVSCWIGAR